MYKNVGRGDGRVIEGISTEEGKERKEGEDLIYIYLFNN